MYLPTVTPSWSFGYLASINAMLTRPATGPEIAEAAFRVNTDLQSYYSRVPIDRTPLLQMPVGTRLSMRSLGETIDNPQATCSPKQALYYATCMAIYRGEAERLRPPAKPVIRRPQALAVT